MQAERFFDVDVLSMLEAEADQGSVGCGGWETLYCKGFTGCGSGQRGADD